MMVTMTDTASLDLEQDLAILYLIHRELLDLERFLLGRDDRGLEGLGKIRGCHCLRVRSLFSCVGRSCR